MCTTHRKLPKHITDRESSNGSCNYATDIIVSEFDNVESWYDAKLALIYNMIRLWRYHFTAKKAKYLVLSYIDAKSFRETHDTTLNQVYWVEVAENFQADLDATLAHLREFYHKCNHCDHVSIKHPQHIKLHNGSQYCYSCYRRLRKADDRLPMWSTLKDAPNTVTDN